MKCEYCEKEFTPHAPHQRFCCRKCTNKAEREREHKVYDRICPVCCTSFQTRKEHKRFCCPDCADEYKDIRADVLLRTRSKIIDLIEYARQNPDVPTYKIIKERYPR